MVLLVSNFLASLSTFALLVQALPANDPPLRRPIPFWNRKDVIIDTDFLSFTDDVGALAVANTLQCKGYARILGIVADVQSRYAVPAMDGINTWYRHPNIPFAQAKPVTDQVSEVNNTAPEYITTLADPTRFPQDIIDGNNAIIEEPVAMYRRLLGKAKPKSITIIGIGFLTHLNELYHSEGGPELIEEKVAELIIQGGDFGPNRFDPGPNRAGYNLLIDLEASKVLEEWPSPVTFMGANIGRSILTGQVLENTPEQNPIRVANEIYHNGPQIQDGSWDIVATYFAIYGLGEGSFQYGNNGGQIRIFDNGTAGWDFDTVVPSTRAQHFLNLRVENTTVGAEVDRLLAYYGPNRPSGFSCLI